MNKESEKMISKKELRKEVLARRDALHEKERQEKSARISKQVTEQDVFQKADKILLFSSFKSEVDTTYIFREARRLNKDIYYPKVLGKEMEFYLVDETTQFETSNFGINEPKIDKAKKFVPSMEDRIFVLMPGVVFDENGNRIGYGGGYYDKYLQQLERKLPKERICKTAVAFECQMVETSVIKSEEHDMKPDYIITEDRKITKN